METLTKNQNELIKNLVAEFQKMNSSNVVVNKSGRFTAQSIVECINEKQKVIDEIKKYNSEIFGFLIKNIEKEIEMFKAEFGNLFNIQIGRIGAAGFLSNYKYDIDLATNYFKERNGNDLRSVEVQIFIVSKKRQYTCDSRYNYCNGMTYQMLYISFDTERITTKLESGETFETYKLKDISFKMRDYLNDNTPKYKTIDELIQNENSVKQKMVAMCK